MTITVTTDPTKPSGTAPPGAPSIRSQLSTPVYDDIVALNINIGNIESDIATLQSDVTAGLSQMSVIETDVDAMEANWATLAPVATSGDYIDLDNKPSIPAAQVNSDWNSGSGLSQILNKPTIPAAQIQSDWTQSSSGSADFIKNKPAARSTSYTTRTLNSAFQISSTRDAIGTYAVDISSTISLTTGQTGTVFLEIADDSGFTTNVQEVTRFVNGNTGTLTIGLNLTQNVTGTLTGYIPAAKYARLRTSGTATFTSRPSQETLL